MNSMIELTKHKLHDDIFNEGALKLWTDWKWQVSHTIRKIETVEKILGIQFSEDEKAKITKTISHFPSYGSLKGNYSFGLGVSSLDQRRREEFPAI